MKAKFRYDVENKKVVELLDSGIPILKVASIMGCSSQVIHNIKHGKRIQHHAPPKVKGKACSYCGIRRVGTGKRFLCDVCYREGTPYEMDMASPLHNQRRYAPSV